MASLDPTRLKDTLIGGKYRLGPVIGSGGVATVYRATHLWTEREVAVKLLDPTLPHFDRVREGFLREARATVQLEHPNVVDILDMGEDNWETAYLVMELLHGPTLRDVLYERGRLSEEETLELLSPLIDALERAHELGIVHRDFKPENIILTNDAYGMSTPKLVDFGVAEILQDARSRNLASTNDVIMGTPQYMSPEQARDERTQIGPHTDVWGVGVVWYECLTGRAPFDGESAAEVLRAVCDAPIDFEPVPEAYIPLLRDALDREPRRRIGTLSEFKARISDIGLARFSNPPAGGSVSSEPWQVPEETGIRRTLSGLGPEKRSLAPTSTPEIDTEIPTVPRWAPRKATLVAFSLAILVASIGWWVASSPKVEPPPAAKPTSEAAEAFVDRAEPDPMPAEGIAAAYEGDATETTDEIDVEPAEPAQHIEEVAEDTKPTKAKGSLPKPRRKTAPAGTPESSAPDASPYRKPPDLVTEW